MAAPSAQPRLAAAALAHFVVGARRLTLPDTAVDLAWVDGRVEVIGPMTVARRSTRPVGTRVVLLRVDPVAASRWLGAPLHVLSDRVIDLRDIDARLAASLAERFADESVRDLVASAAAPPRPPVSRADVAAAHLVRGARIADAAAAVNLEERQFTRWFHHLFGMNPKRFQRVVRLRGAMIEAKRGAGLAFAAADAGYADQAHFSREARSLTGGSPKSILPDVGNVQDFDLPLG